MASMYNREKGEMEDYDDHDNAMMHDDEPSSHFEEHAPLDDDALDAGQEVSNFLMHSHSMESFF